YHLVYPDSIRESYATDLFHGEFFQALEEIYGWSEKGIAARCKAALPPENWSGDTLCTRWYSDPLALDSAYQLMILWTTKALGAPSLPTRSASYRQYCRKFPERVLIRASAQQTGAHSARAEIDFLDENEKVLARMQGYECTINNALTEAFKHRKIHGA
ncbi:MAG: polyketide synthase dehydratase domain-containing protein, partial [Candidatus Rifleibacteriota bacterium]